MNDLIDNKITYLKKQLVTAVTNNDIKSVDRYYNKLIELGVQKQELQFAEISLVDVKPKNAFEELKEIEEIIKKTYEDCKMKKKIARIFMIVGLIIIICGAALIETLDFAIFLLLGGLPIFWYGIFCGFVGPYDKKAEKIKKQIYEQHINNFDTYMSIIDYNDDFLEEKLVWITKINFKLLKGTVRIGDTLYINGKLYEVFQMYVAGKEMDEVSRKNTNIMCTVEGTGLPPLKELTYAIKI